MCVCTQICVVVGVAVFVWRALKTLKYELQISHPYICELNKFSVFRNAFKTEKAHRKQCAYMICVHWWWWQRRAISFHKITNGLRDWEDFRYKNVLRCCTHYCPSGYLRSQFDVWCECVHWVSFYCSFIVSPGILCRTVPFAIFNWSQWNEFK